MLAVRRHAVKLHVVPPKEISEGIFDMVLVHHVVLRLETVQPIEAIVQRVIRQYDKSRVTIGDTPRAAVGDLSRRPAKEDLRRD